jgi:NTE family protein
VLAGGGSKGAYEAGFIKALKELNIEYSIVTGTSIGALNGCLLAENKYNELMNLWKTMDINTVFAGGFRNDFSFLDIEKMLDQSNLVASFFKTYIKEKGADITPLKTLIRGLLDEDALLTSPMDFGLCTVSFPSLKPLLITKEEMEKQYIFDYLISSASCFPVFPIHSFNGQSYIDGGYYDNVPIDLAFDMGADEVIVVDMKKSITHEYYIHKPNVKYTYPLIDLGGFLDFSREQLDRNMRIGYQTAMKEFHQLEGLMYTFYKNESDIYINFYKEIMRLERELRINNRNDNSNILSKRIEDEYIYKQLNIKDYLYVVMDWLGTLIEKDVSYIYDFSLFQKDILKEFEQYASQDFKLVNIESSEDILNTFKSVNKKAIVGKIYHQLLYPKKQVITFDRCITLFTKEALMAKALYFLYYN